MIKENTDYKSMLDYVTQKYNPKNITVDDSQDECFENIHPHPYTHIAYVVGGDNELMTLTKVGVASAEGKGDFNLSINSKFTISGDVLLFKKE